MKYRKTALIDAEQFNVASWSNGLYLATKGIKGKAKREKARVKYCNQTGIYNDTKHGGFRLKTLEGNLIIKDGDWIATGVKSERWPIAPDIFNQTYEAVI